MHNSVIVSAGAAQEKGDAAEKHTCDYFGNGLTGDW